MANMDYIMSINLTGSQFHELLLSSEIALEIYFICGQKAVKSELESG